PATDPAPGDGVGVWRRLLPDLRIPVVRVTRCAGRRAGDTRGHHAGSVCVRNHCGLVALPMRNRLKVLRAERNWTQSRLAQELRVSRLSVNEIRTGKYGPSLPLAFAIARVFGQPIETIFTDGSGA